ncbi:pancreatic triacylglycerol lipase [Bicyclus anynana]|uniref:Pancreatic triacylglycerol lipase n=1 Tax=Bicyclus anynana TaxID=110368 RepID=A0A6J1NSV5_BICAN|nr:pancreatic triacylglycerol lipase [Bicyclus anynana]
MIFLIVIVVLISTLDLGTAGRDWVTTEEFENYITPEDMREFIKWCQRNDALETNEIGGGGDVNYAVFDETTALPVPDTVDCFGLGLLTRALPLDMQPGTSDDVNTHFYFSSRRNPARVQVFPGSQFGLEWVDFKPERKTVMIVHGFMSHSNASWVLDMTRAFLEWHDVNVIVVDWSRGGNTWKYWRAVANTRRVGSDITGFMKQLMAATGARVKDFHFVGHSLGAHIASYVSYHIGKVARITGLDPAQPCFQTSNRVERLDDTDADFVDVIHTNGRLLHRIGFGLPDPIGHADFYPNGGMQQPGCKQNNSSLWQRLLPVARLQQAICNHGRSYLLFTESLINSNCSFRAHQWNLTYEGVNASLIAACRRFSSCSVMGINAVGDARETRANGAYFVLTTERNPYCPTEAERRHPTPDLLKDLRRGFRIDRSAKDIPTPTPAYADPDVQEIPTTTAKNWFWRLVSNLG